MVTVVTAADELEAGALDLDDAIDDGAEEERGADEEDAGNEDERAELLGTELDSARLETTLDCADEATPLHKLPFSVGNSALPPFFSTWNPKVALWPGCKLPFQPTFVAV